MRAALTLLLSGLSWMSPAAIAADAPARLADTWYAPRAAAFVQASAPLAPGLQALCAAEPAQAEAALANARQRWRDALAGWESLSGVALGPVLERRSQRQIDFTPTRPRLIEKAVKAAPQTAADLELIGTPAKGLPALEWLLWTQPAQPGSAECRYAAQLAGEIAREAQALAAAPWVEADAAGALAEQINQWIGGLERLRWSGMELPVRVMQMGGRHGAEYPRQASGATALAWAAQWQAIKSLALEPAGMRAQLVEQGQTGLAEQLTQALARADAEMARLAAADTAQVLAAARELASLKALVQDAVAPALGVSIGFSDADGD